MYMQNIFVLLSLATNFLCVVNFTKGGYFLGDLRMGCRYDYCLTDNSNCKENGGWGSGAHLKIS